MFNKLNKLKKVIDIEKTALVLEGGGMRGVFTCGVLDYLMDANIRFPFVVGVSAGACNGLSYISNQPERAKKSNIDVLNKYKYIGINNIFKKGNIMDLNFLYNILPEKVLPFDYDTFFNSPARFVMVTTNCLTGKAEYMEETLGNRKRLLDICKASSSLPFINPIVNIDGVPFMDGGIADSIPVQYAFDQGYEHAVVVLTRNEDYRKSGNALSFFSGVYRKYPNFCKALKERTEMYNAQMDMVEKLEKEGKITVIRPLNPITVGRLEKDVLKLTKLYDEGYYFAIETFLQNNAENKKKKNQPESDLKKSIYKTRRNKEINKRQINIR